MSGGIGVRSLRCLAVGENHIADRPGFGLARLDLWSQVAAAYHRLCSAVPADVGGFLFPDEVVHRGEGRRGLLSPDNEE